MTPSPSRCRTRGCRRAELVPEQTTILRGPDRVPVTLTVLRCPVCRAATTPHAERERLARVG